MNMLQGPVLFGDWHGAPITEQATSSGVPMDETCTFCNQGFEEDSVGMWMPHFVDGKGTAAPVHRSCLIGKIVPPWDAAPDGH